MIWQTDNKEEFNGKVKMITCRVREQLDGVFGPFTDKHGKVKEFCATPKKPKYATVDAMIKGMKKAGVPHAVIVQAVITRENKMVKKATAAQKQEVQKRIADSSRKSGSRKSSGGWW